jgi:hypothetical protein
MRRAYVEATMAKVHCPHCHEVVVQDGVEQYSLRELLGILGGRKSVTMICGACSRPFILHAQTIHGVL